MSRRRRRSPSETEALVDARMESLGKSLDEARARAGVSVPQIAARCGLSVRTVSYALAGQALSVRTLFQLALGLDLDVAILPFEPHVRLLARAPACQTPEQLVARVEAAIAQAARLHPEAYATREDPLRPLPAYGNPGVPPPHPLRRRGVLPPELRERPVRKRGRG